MVTKKSQMERWEGRNEAREGGGRGWGGGVGRRSGKKELGGKKGGGSEGTHRC